MLGYMLLHGQMTDILFNMITACVTGIEIKTLENDMDVDKKEDVVSCLRPLSPALCFHTLVLTADTC